MRRNRRTKFEYDGPLGSDPEYGAIFMSNSSTRKECLRRGLFGLPYKQAKFVKQVKHGMVLFLFDYETRELHGVFQACSDGAMNIVPDAFCSSGMQFPAQVKFTPIWHCRPLPENEFCETIRENYFSGHKFNFGLSEVQVRRLLSLFRLKKLDRPSSMRNVAMLSTGQRASELSNAIGEHCVQYNSEVESGGNIDRELDFSDVPSGDCFANSSNPVKDSRLTALCGMGVESNIGQEYDIATGNGNVHHGDASGEFRRFTHHRVPSAKGLLGNEFGMSRNFGRDATVSPFSLDTNIRVPENPRHTESDRSENEYLVKDDDFTLNVSTKYSSLWSNPNQSAEHGRGSVEVDPQILVPRRVPLELYATNRETYCPTYLRFLGDGTRENCQPYDPDAPALATPPFSTMGLSSCVLGQQFTSCGGYVLDSPPPEMVQPFSVEHSGASKHATAVFDLGDYVPLPGTHPVCSNSTSLIGIQRLPEEHSGASKHASADFFSSNYFPPPSTRPVYLDSTSMVGVTDSEAVSTNHVQNGSRIGISHHLPRPNFVNSVESVEEVRNCKSLPHCSSPSGYPSFLHHFSSGDGVDLPCKDGFIASHGDFCDGAPDSNNRASGARDQVNHAALKTQRARRSVFDRLVLPLKECDTKRDTSGDIESIDEVMAFVHELLDHLPKQRKVGSHPSNPNAGEEFEMKKRKVCAAEILEDGTMSFSAETVLDDDLALEEIMQQPMQKPHFIDFKRRSERRKSLGNQTQGCIDSLGDPSSRHKKRKLVRPKLILEEISVEGVSASPSVCEEAKEGTIKVPLVKLEDNASENHPGKDGVTNGNKEDMPNCEEAKEDTVEMPLVKLEDSARKNHTSEDGETNENKERICPISEEAKEEASTL